jgi:uncharacterized protein YcsI (UPF0317 family)
VNLIASQAWADTTTVPPGSLVVSMRPIPRQMIFLAAEVTAR